MHNNDTISHSRYLVFYSLEQRSCEYFQQKCFFIIIFLFDWILKMENKEQQNVLCETKQQMCEQYAAIQNWFDQLPIEITNLKKQYILDKATVNARFVMLCLGALSSAALTARISPSLIKVTRNTVVTYVGAGLFVVPEVFNPYLFFRQ
ncbi:unnamed protein product [Paramecium octaurelia]|uniref:Uncharacterized protein n=1 Tax=Paramecium octaurelia TaxID=43137 RepID=A0A8S1WDG8_PAROT|nr:unnamed protein product [Paramecium octaurelia]